MQCHSMSISYFLRQTDVVYGIAYATSYHLINFAKNLHRNNSENSHLDIIDNFTNRLIQEKSKKWRVAVRKSSCQFDDERKIDLFKMHKAVDRGDYNTSLKLINYYVANKECPKLHILNKILSLCSRNGNIGAIQSISNLIGEVNPSLLNMNSNFEYHIAEAIWIRGNIEESLRIYENIYRSNLFLRRKLRFMLKSLVNDTIAERSEANLIKMIRFSENMVAEFNDHFFISFVWEICFLSEWVTDRLEAEKLIEKFPVLLQIIGQNLYHILFRLAGAHDTDAFHRLLEMFLKYNMLAEVTKTVQALFTYKLFCNDLLSCTEIIHWAEKIGVPLKTSDKQKYISLYLLQGEEKKETSKPPVYKF